MNKYTMIHNLTRTPQWLQRHCPARFLQGLAALTAMTAMHASAEFTAYNDCTQSTGNPANTTLYRGNATTSGFLKDFDTGTTLPVTLTIVADSGIQYAGGGGPMPKTGTDCYNVFNGKVVFDNVAFYGTYMEARFTGLDPNKEYEVVTSANRGNSGYTTRTTQFTISDIDSATQAGTAGVTVNSPTSVTFLTGFNTDNGYVARWTNIKCGADGDFTLRNDNGAGTSNGYSMDGIMLKETGGVPPTAPYGLVATGGDAQVSLTWVAFPGADSYKVKRWNELTSVYDTVGTPGTNSYTDTPLTNGTNYRYVVSAMTGAVESDNSTEVNAMPTSVDAGLSSVVAYLPAVWADGTATSTIIVTLKNASGPVAGKDVTLMPSGAAVVTTVTGTTGVDGKATFTAVSNSPGVETFTATDITDTPNIAVAQQGQVTFKTQPADLSVYVPANIPAGGVVTVLKTWDAAAGWTGWEAWGNWSVDIYGNKVLGVAPSGPRGAMILDIRGKPGLETLSYFDSGLEVTYIGAIQRIAGDAATYAEMLTWDGDISGNTRQGFIIDAPGGTGSTGDAVQTIQMFSDGNRPAYNWPVNTDLDGLHTMTLLRLANGNVQAYVDGVLKHTLLGTVDPLVALTKIAFGYEFTGNHYIQPGTIVQQVKAFNVSYPVGAPDAGTSTVVSTSAALATPTWIYANGSDAATVTVALKDGNGNAVAGKDVSLSYTGPGTLVITPSTSQTSGPSGKAVFTVKTTDAGTYQFSATGDGVGITQQATVLCHSILTWGAATDDTLTGDSTAYDQADVKTDGTFVAAVTNGNGGTLNGVTFTRWTAFTSNRYVTYGTSPISMAWAPDAGRNQNGWGAPSNAYGAFGYSDGSASNLLLTGGGEGDSPGTVTLASLTPGHSYQVQVWSATWNQTLSTTVAGISLRIGQSPPGTKSQNIVGTFTADSTGSERILWSSIAPVAISLRDLTPTTEMAEILTFTFPDAIATTIDQVTQKIAVSVPYTASVEDVTPTYTVSGLAHEDPVYPSGSIRSFTSPQTYTIKSDDGNVTKVYTVTVTPIPPILVGPSGSGTLTFDTLPSALQWSTLTAGVGAGGNSGTYPNTDAMDTAMAGIAASSITNTLGSRGNTSGADAFWRNDTKKLETFTASCGMTVLMATLRNTSGGAIDSLDVSYTLEVTSVAEQVYGHRVYWAKPGSGWTAVGNFERTTPGSTAVSFSVPALSWANGDLLYVVWADDNGSGTDGDFTIDNVSFTKSVSGGYGAWAAAWAPGQAANEDHDNDGVANGIEYFMGETGSTFTANPAVVDGKVSWKMAVSAAYAVKVSTDLKNWDDAPAGNVKEEGGYVVFTLPNDGPVLFTRLEVAIP